MDIGDRETQRLVSLEEAIGDLGARSGDPSAQAARQGGAEQAVGSQPIAELGDQARRRLDAALERCPGVLIFDPLGQAAPAADELLREREQLAVAAVLGWMEGLGGDGLSLSARLRTRSFAHVTARRFSPWIVRWRRESRPGGSAGDSVPASSASR